MNIEEVPKLIQELSKKTDVLFRAMLLAGICPYCGAKTTIEPEGQGKSFVCSCNLRYWLSDKAIFNIKRGKDATADE
jgi:hypothetical protein